jgi:hypothetical protein
MSAHNESDFDRLLAAHCNRDLGPAEFERLQVMARDDDARAREVREVDELHRIFDAERALFVTVAAPLEPREEADEVYRGLSQRAARAEQTLRDLGADGAGEPVLRLSVWTARRLWAAAAAAAAAAVLVLAFAAALGVFSPAEPDDLRLRAVTPIQLEPEISATSREISWHTVVGARTYDVVITDEDNAVILARPDTAARSTIWELTPAEFTRLESFEGSLYLRVVARDGSEIEITTTGDLLLKIR